MRFRQMLLLNVVGAVVIIGLLIAGYLYYYNQNNYVATDDASIQVNPTNVVAIAAGRLSAWNIHDDTNVTKGQIIGVETLPTGQTVDFTSPISGQVLKQNGVAGEVVAPGTLLAVLGNLAQEYVVANVPETQIRHLAVGQSVDIYLDAYPGTTFAGTVTNIGSVSAAYTSILPAGTSAGNFTKEVQRVPVDIALSGNEGKLVLPAMNARVRIHRNNP